MTTDEALLVARVVRKADNGCPTCVGALFSDLAEVFPGHDWEALEKQADWIYEAQQAEYVAHDYDDAYEPSLKRGAPTATEVQE